MSVQNIDNAIIGIVTGEISFSLMILLKPRSYFVCSEKIFPKYKFNMDVDYIHFQSDFVY